MLNLDAKQLVQGLVDLAFADDNKGLIPDQEKILRGNMRNEIMRIFSYYYTIRLDENGQLFFSPLNPNYAKEQTQVQEKEPTS